MSLRVWRMPTEQTRSGPYPVEIVRSYHATLYSTVDVTALRIYPGRVADFSYITDRRNIRPWPLDREAPIGVAVNVPNLPALHGRIVTCDGYCEEIERPLPKGPPGSSADGSSDAEIRHNLESELQWDPRIDDSKIGVIVHRGIVTLTGEVSSYSGRCAIERIAGRIDGIRAIANEVQLNLPEWGIVSDAEIAEAAIHVLRWNVATRWSRITPIVSGGEVILTGQVAWRYQKEAAEKLVGELSGVIRIIDDIELRPLLSKMADQETFK